MKWLEAIEACTERSEVTRRFFFISLRAVVSFVFFVAHNGVRV